MKVESAGETTEDTIVLVHHGGVFAGPKRNVEGGRCKIWFTPDSNSSQNVELSTSMIAIPGGPDENFMLYGAGEHGPYSADFDDFLKKCKPSVSVGDERYELDLSEATATSIDDYDSADKESLPSRGDAVKYKGHLVGFVHGVEECTDVEDDTKTKKRISVLLFTFPGPPLHPTSKYTISVWFPETLTDESRPFAWAAMNWCRCRSYSWYQNIELPDQPCIAITSIENAEKVLEHRDLDPLLTIILVGKMEHSSLIKVKARFADARILSHECPKADDLFSILDLLLAGRVSGMNGRPRNRRERATTLANTAADDPTEQLLFSSDYAARAKAAIEISRQPTNALKGWELVKRSIWSLVCRVFNIQPPRKLTKGALIEIIGEQAAADRVNKYLDVTGDSD